MFAATAGLQAPLIRTASPLGLASRDFPEAGRGRQGLSKDRNRNESAMINGLYSATSGMYVQQARLDVISSNIANANVPGFKGERLLFRSFPDLLRVEMQRGDASPESLGPLGGGAALDEVATIQSKVASVNRELGK